MFLNLGQRYYWSDEHPTPLLARNILKFGYPKSFDGTYYAQNYYYNNNPLMPSSLIFNEKHVWIYQPWLNDYITAFSFLLFGDNNFAGKFFNALFGLGTIILTYFLALRLTQKRDVALLSLLFMATSVTVYLYSRTVRYYALLMFFSLAVYFSYVYFIQEKKGGHWLALSMILLFHSNVTASIPIILSVICHYVIFRRYDTYKKFICLIIAAAIFTVPWFIYAKLWANTNSVGLSLANFIPNILSSYFFISILWFPIIFLIFMEVLSFFKHANSFFSFSLIH